MHLQQELAWWPEGKIWALLVFVQITKCISQNYQMYFQGRERLCSCSRVAGRVAWAGQEFCHRTSNSTTWTQLENTSLALSPSTFLNQNVFLQAVKWISPNCQMYFSKLTNVFLQNLSKLPNVFVQIRKCISPNCQMYLSKLPNVFLQIAKCICPNYQMYFSKLKMYLSKLWWLAPPLELDWKIPASHALSFHLS